MDVLIADFIPHRQSNLYHRCIVSVSWSSSFDSSYKDTFKPGRTFENNIIFHAGGGWGAKRDVTEVRKRLPLSAFRNAKRGRNGLCCGVFLQKWALKSGNFSQR